MAEDWLRKKRAQMRAEEKAEKARLEKVWAEIHADGWKPSVADVKAIISICGGDGHGVYAPETFKTAGVNERWVDLMTSVYKSDGSYKGSLWDGDGNMVAEQTGVDSESLLIATAEMLGMEGNWRWQNGRGFRAQSATKALYEWMVEAEKSG